MPPTTVLHALHAQIQARPEQWAYSFLENGETEVVRWTYGDLDRRARSVAAWVRGLGAQRGERVLLVFPYHACPAFVETFWGCLYAGVVPVPAVPPDEKRLSRTLPRLRDIAQDARTGLALTTAEVARAIPGWEAVLPEITRLRWAVVDARPESSDALAPVTPRPEDLCFLQYTSGSTSTPRGVMVAHGNLADNCGYIRSAWIREGAVSVSWCPVFHDMGLILGLLGPLCAGVPTVQMSPIAFMLQPLRWLRAITRYRGTYSGGPNFAYDLCVRRLRPGDLDALDLSAWEVGYCGAEPIRHRTVEAFIETFTPRGFRREAFRPGFGLAESVVLTSASQSGPRYFWVDAAALEQHRYQEQPAHAPGAKPLVGCGQILRHLGVEARIVDPDTRQPAGPSEVGELWLAGPSVCQGYWNKPEATAQTFGAHLATGEGPYLRTGDLGVLRGDDWVLTGRRKDLILLLGRNVYPQDVELTAEQSHPLLRRGCGAAFAVEVGEEERVGLAIEVDKGALEPVADPAALREIVAAIRRAVAEAHEAALEVVVLLRPGSLPKTSSGKLQRATCRAAVVGGGLEGTVLLDRNPLSRGAKLG